MIANYHAHTWRCNHAQGTEEEYVRQGLARGLEIIGFSDHSPYPFPGGYVSTFRMGMEQLDDYIQTILDLRERYAHQAQIPLGLEIEYYPELLPQLLPVLRDRPIDYLLLGQHYLGNEMGEHYNGRPTDDVTLLRRYSQQVCRGMEQGIFTYLAHPDLFYFTGDRQTYCRHMRQICVQSNQCKMPLELNLLGLAQGRNYPNMDFWRMAAEEGCTVVLGCDAHAPQMLSDQAPEQRALAMVRELGLKLVDRVALRSLRG